MSVSSAKMYNDYILVDPVDNSKTNFGLHLVESTRGRGHKKGIVKASCGEFDGREAPEVGNVIIYDATNSYEPVEFRELVDGEEKSVKYDLILLRQVIARVM